MTDQRRFLAPPVFDDEFKERKLRLLHVIIWGMILVPIPYLLYYLIAMPEYLTRALVQTAFGESINVILLLLLRRGHITSTSIVQVSLLWLFFTVSAFTSDGTRGAAYLLGYPLVIVLAGVLLGGKAATITTVFSLILGGILAYAETEGWFVLQVTEGPFVVWAVSLAIFPLSAALQHLTWREFRNALLRAQESEENYRLISQVISDYTFSTELDSNDIMHLNWVAGAFEKITGYTFEEYAATGGWLAHLHPDDVEKDKRDMAALKNNERVVTEIRTYAKDGDLRWVRVYAHPVWDDAQTKLTGVVGAVQDITKQRVADEREQRHRGMLEKVVRLGKIVTEVSDLQTTLERIWHGVHDDLGFDRLGIFLYNPERCAIQGVLGTDNQGQMIEIWERWYSLSENAMFSRLLAKPEGVYFTHNYEAENGIGQYGSMEGVKDHAAVAAWAGDKPIAIICVDNLITGRPIGEDEVEALRLFGGYAGLAIENTRLNLALQNELEEQKRQEDRELHHREMLEKVVKLGKAVTEVNDLQTTLERIWHGVHDDLGFDRLGIFLYNPERHSMDGTLGTDNLGQMLDESDRSYPLSGIAIFTRLMDKPNGVYFTHNFEVENGSGEEGDMVGVMDYAAVAAWAGDKPIAIICVDNLLTGRPIRDEDVEGLRLFSGYAGLAVENAKLNLALQNELMEQKQQKERELRHRALLEKVIRLGKIVTEVSDLRTTLVRIWHGVHDDLGFDRLGIFLYSPEHHSMQGTLGTDHLGQIIEEWHYLYPLSDVAIFTRVLAQPNGLYFTHNYEAENGIGNAGDMVGVKDYAAVAASVGDNPIAVICVDNLITDRPIEEEQLEALRLFAGYAGLAIENARLNNALQNELTQRQSFIDELESKNTELERFTYTVSHDLKSPLVTITGFLGYLEKDALSGDQEKVKKTTQRITLAAQKMQSLLDGLLELSRFGRIMNLPEHIPLEEIVREAVEQVRGRLDVMKAEIKLQTHLPVVYGDRIRLIEVMQNLIDNAAKYVHPGTIPCIEIGAKDEQHQTIVFVRDNGVGIDPQFHDRIFGLFNKLDTNTEGTGIGLSLVKRIIDVHGGNIWVESELGTGATFYFTLPKTSQK